MIKDIYVIYIVAKNQKGIKKRLYKKYENMAEAHEAFLKLQEEGYGCVVSKKHVDNTKNICVVCGKEIISTRKKKTCSGTCRNRLCKIKKEGLV